MQTRTMRFRARQILLLASVWGAIGCSASLPPGDGTRDVEDGLPGKPNDSEETLAHLRSLEYEEDPENHAEERFACSNCGTGNHTTLYFTPVKFAHEVSWPKALKKPGNGHFVAKIKNTGEFTAKLGLPKGDSAYLWVGLVEKFGPFEDRSVAVYWFKNGKIKRLAKGSRRYCSTEEPPVSAIHLHSPKQCTDTEITPPKGPAHKKSDDPPPPGELRHHMGLWIACGGGCCEASFSEM